ncbi:hypothetical protein MKQ70_26485 [Chitinophaga sedimenti]|uniref:hypothetical protein n=1 Tax=Chitinophaga sedimenti TaxID=2033606 RepID=UPI00200362E8|nr:hypothetical protein [Chitinophaga sedimenti]MCK7558357.1 hypothetical protein [Chitinophaga sedimenti]
MCKSIFAGLLLTAAALTVNGQSVFPEQKNYVSLFTTDSITIDGKGNERAWQHAPWSDAFIDIEGNTKPRPYRIRG